MKPNQPAAKPKKPRDPSVVLKQTAFADAVLEGKSASEAARIAGYHPSNASQKMREEEIQDMLAKAREELTNVSSLKRIDVLNMFVEAIDMARTMADPGNMINGADKIAKMMGYYAPETLKLDMTTNQSALQSKLKQLSDADLLEMASGRMKVIEGEVIQ